jgi:hypothetical protein
VPGSSPHQSDYLSDSSNTSLLEIAKKNYKHEEERMIELHGEDSDSDKEDGAEESDSKHQTTKKASGSESKNHEGNIDELDPAEDESDESSGGSSVDLRLYMVNRGRITQSDDSKSNVPVSFKFSFLHDSFTHEANWTFLRTGKRR